MKNKATFERKKRGESVWVTCLRLHSNPLQKYAAREQTRLQARRRATIRIDLDIRAARSVPRPADSKVRFAFVGNEFLGFLNGTPIPTTVYNILYYRVLI